jgi:hypothetical protein
MVNSDDWIEYKNLIMKRLDDVTKLEEDIVTIKVQMAVLTTKVVLITASVALGTSAMITALTNYMIKGGV